MLSYCDKSLNIHGVGSFTKRHIKAGELIGAALIKLSDTDNPDEDYIRTPLGRYVNHSNKPNAKISKLTGIYCFVARRDIKPNEELTVDYREFDFDGEREFIKAEV